MLRSSLIAASSVILCATASAQQGATAQQVPGAVKNAGIYHVATGTWTRAASSGANLGTDVLYRNDAGSGYFSTLGSAGAVGDYSLVDEGRIPTSGGSVPGTTNTEYCVNGLQFGYCSSIVGPNVGITFNLYESYAPCDLVATGPVNPVVLAGSITGAGLPGGTTAGAACWIVTLDVEGVGEFFLEGDGGSAFPGEDADINTDAFGIEWMFANIAGTSTGPLLNGDPDWTASVVGAQFWGGGGTYYAAETGCASTGLDTQDFFAVDGANSPLNPGCYFFGGYKNTNGCGGPSNNPFGSFTTTLFGTNTDTTCDSGGQFTSFCDPAGVNANGNMAALTGVADGAAGSGVALNCSGGTVGQAGIIIVSANAGGQVAISNGFLCLQGFGRYNSLAGAGGNSLGTFNAAGDFASLTGNGDAAGLGFRVPSALPSPPGGSIMGGQTWNFQLWYRDVPAQGTFNFSNGVAVQF